MYHYTMDLEIYDPIKNDKIHFNQYLDNTKKAIDYIFNKLNQNKIKITCFVTNEFVENFYDNFIKKIAQYHEISCHTAYHDFYNGTNEKQFFESIRKNKSYLEKVTGRGCYGFRAPGGVVPKNLVSYLLKLNFKYDSSVIPGLIPGRLSKFFSPKSSYFPNKNNIFKIGENQSELIEFPLAVFPFFNFNVNGFFYPYLFIPFKSFFYNKEITTYIHLNDFIDITGKKFFWDYFKLKKFNLTFFDEFIEKYKDSDMSLINKWCEGQYPSGHNSGNITENVHIR